VKVVSRVQVGLSVAGWKRFDEKRGVNIESSVAGEILSGQPLTLNEVQKKCGASRTTLHRWRYELPEDLRLHQVKIRNHVRVYESQLEDFFRRNQSLPTV
jgi:hypothetical protein